MTRRALVLAGGGMRVAWQAGVVQALDDAGLTFDHVDGTSGGIMNAAALLSGVTPNSLCDRWSSLDVKRFVSPVPLRKYLRPTQAMSFGDADGVVEHIFPHLGIDMKRVNAATKPTATFNVCDFGDKVSIAIPNDVVSLDHLVAGMSLPIAMPPVEHGGTTWTDAVWIRDANLMEAVERGADEIWLVWCIGNTGRYGRGPLEQYVHMIEMSAAGALNAELDQIAGLNKEREKPIVVHVVKPHHPLPLDPDFLAGRIDAHTLVCMGHRDAHAYLNEQPGDGVPLDSNASKMEEPGRGVRVHLRAAGQLISNGDPHGSPVSVRVGVELHGIDDIAGQAHVSAPIVGSMTFDDGETALFATGSLVARGATIEYSATLRRRGQQHTLTVRQDFSDGVLNGCAQFDTRLAADGTSPFDDAVGILTSSRRDVARTVLSIEPSGVHNLRDRAASIRALVRFMRKRRQR